MISLYMYVDLLLSRFCRVPCLAFSLNIREGGGILCFIQTTSQLMYPMFNTIGTTDFDRFLVSYNNVSSVCVDGEPCIVTPNEPLDVSEAMCTPCNATLTSAEIRSCGESCVSLNN
jgi:hypothetical protein